MQKDWLEEEINEINKEIKKNSKMKKSDTKTMFRFLLFLIPFLGYAIYSNASIECPRCGSELEIGIKAEKGVSWRCKKCKRYNYSETPDWMGNYYCTTCGTRMGDE